MNSNHVLDAIYGKKWSFNVHSVQLILTLGFWIHHSSLGLKLPSHIIDKQSKWSVYEIRVTVLIVSHWYQPHSSYFILLLLHIKVANWESTQSFYFEAAKGTSTNCVTKVIADCDRSSELDIENKATGVWVIFWQQISCKCGTNGTQTEQTQQAVRWRVAGDRLHTPPTPRGNQLHYVLLLRGKLLALCTAWSQISAHNMIERV